MSQIRTQVDSTGQVHAISADRVDPHLAETAAVFSDLSRRLALPLVG